MTCTKDQSERRWMFIRLLILFIIDSLILFISLMVYSYKFTKFAYTDDSENGEDPRQLAKLHVRFDPPQKVTWKLMRKTLSSMVHSIPLHLNRYSLLFMFSMVCFTSLLKRSRMPKQKKPSQQDISSLIDH